MIERRDCGADLIDAPALEGLAAFNFTLPPSLRGALATKQSSLALAFWIASLRSQ
jgi:hypothetical protein